MNRLNHLIYEHFAPGVLVNSEERKYTCLREVRAEKMKITAAMRQLAQQQAPWDYKARELRKHQVQTVLLLDTLHQYHQRAEADLQLFYESAAATLEEVLTALEQHFPEYLAQDIFMPAGYARQVVAQLEDRFCDTEKYLCDRGVDRRLLALVIHPLRMQQTYLTFGMVMYYRRLLPELKENVHPFITDITEKVHYTLHQYNFNAPDYFLYCTSQLRKKVSRLRTLQEKKALLSWYEKELRGMNGHGVTLYPGKGGLREQMLTWLKEEKYFLQTLLMASRS